jgi:hypothetical protein
MQGGAEWLGKLGNLDVGRNLIIFSVQTKIEKMPKIILKQSRLI